MGGEKEKLNQETTPKRTEQLSSIAIYDYWQKKKNLLVLQALISGAIITLLVVLLVVINPQILTGQYGPYFAITATLLTTSFVIYGLARFILKPTEDVLNAINFMIKPNPNIKPPMPNKPEYVKNGFNNVLKFIYNSRTDSDNAQKNTGSDNQNSLKDVLDRASFNLIMLDPNQEIVYNNPGAKAFIAFNNRIHLEYDQEQSIYDWISECQEKAIKSNRTWNKVYLPAESAEKTRFYSLEASFQKGEEIETVLLFTDQTEVYRPDEEDFEFIAFAAHELRGPITIIRGYLDILQNELDPKIIKEQSEIINRLLVSANKLSSYINNILNVSRFDRKHLQIFVHEESVADIFNSIIDDVSLRAQTQYRLLNIDIEENIPTVAADKSSISEVLINLIDNAIKYSHEGSSVEVRAYKQGEFVNFEITDHGIGMPSNVVNNLFKKFYRSHRSRESVAGTGIGLYISKAIIDSHGGYITVKSAPDQGSTFTFSLPIYSTVAEKIRANMGKNDGLIKKQSDGWIKNHGLYKD